MSSTERSLALLFALVCVAQLPVDPVAAAVADSKRQPDDARYVFFGGVSKEQQAKALQMLNRHVNALSSEPAIVQMEPLIPGVGRLYLHNYGKAFGAAWDKQKDPYFGTGLNVVDVADAAVLKVTESKAADGKGRVTLATGKGSLAGSAQGATWSVVTGTWPLVVEHDGQTLKTELKLELGNDYAVSIVKQEKQEKQVALIVHALWFLNQTGAVEDGRSPNYHDFLGVKNQSDFEKIIGLNRDVLKAYKAQAREAIAKSGVARQPRRVDFLGIPGAWLALTFDNRLAVGNRNPLEVPDDTLEFDGIEGIGTRPNGLQAYLLANRQGNLVGSAPDFLATNHLAPPEANDHRIHNYIGCIGCHKSGFNDIAGFYRSTFQKPFKLQSLDKKKLEEIAPLYFSDIEPIINANRASYAAAIMRATAIDEGTALAFGFAEAIKGLKPEEDSENITAWWWAYEKASVTRKYAATDLGVTEDVWVGCLKRRLAVEEYLNPQFVNMLQADLPITIRQWEVLYKDARETVQRYGKGG